MTEIFLHDQSVSVCDDVMLLGKNTPRLGCYVYVSLCTLNTVLVLSDIDPLVGPSDARFEGVLYTCIITTVRS